MPESPRRFVISCGVMAVAAAVILPARAADAVTPPVFWVSGTGNSAHANVSCPTARYSTVQSAVTAAETYESSHPGVVPSVEVCPGTYSEQVTIRKSLALSRAPVPASQGAVTIQLPAAVGSDQSKGLSSTNCQAKDAANGIAVPQSVVAPLGATHSLPHPPAPAFVRPVDIVTGPAIQPETFGNSFDGRPYHPA